MQVFLLFIILEIAAVSTKVTEVSVGEWEVNILENLVPSSIHNIVKQNPNVKPVTYTMECRIRSISSRDVNVTIYGPKSPLNEGLPSSQILKSSKIGRYMVSTNSTIKINEVISIGEGDESTDILGDTLAVFIATENTSYIAFRDSPQNTLDPIPEEIIVEEMYFKKYLDENGRSWNHHFNASGPPPNHGLIAPLRGPPSMHMWDATKVGQTHTVFSQHGHWSCDGFASTCRHPETLPLTLTVVSTSPRVFVIPNFLNSYECDRIVQLAIKGMNVSMTGGGGVSDYRTSLTSWLGRRVSPVIDSLYRRTADLLKVHEKELSRRSELLQVVNYHFGEEYKSHFDWSRQDGFGGNCRYATLLLYLTDQVDKDSGGETLFPNAEAGALAVRPVKGTAVLFYNLSPDGNGDVTSLHQSLPVRKGEKWLSNMWIWDPLYTSK